MKWNNFKGKESLIPVMAKLAKQILTRNPDSPPSSLLALLPEQDKIPSTERLFRGPKSLESINTLGEGDVLNLRGQVFGISADYKNLDWTTCSRIFIPYTDDREAEEAFENLIANLDSYIQIFEKSEPGFTFKDYQGKYGAVELAKNTLDILLNLSKLE